MLNRSFARDNRSRERQARVVTRHACLAGGVHICVPLNTTNDVLGISMGRAAASLRIRAP